MTKLTDYYYTSHIFVISWAVEDYTVEYSTMYIHSEQEEFTYQKQDVKKGLR